jgi:hypothetical protein
MAFKATEIRLDPETRSQLEGWVRASTTEQRYVRRARIVLLVSDGMASRAIAREVGGLGPRDASQPSDPPRAWRRSADSRVHSSHGR